MRDARPVMQPRGLVVSSVLAAGLALCSLACLTPGQTYDVGLQLDQIRQQAEQVRTTQQSNADSIGAIQVAERIPFAPSELEPRQTPHDPGTTGDGDVSAVAGRVAVSEDQAWSRSGAADGLFRQGYALYHRRDYQGAEQLLRRFLAADPDGSMADDALFWIAECRLARGLYRDAILEYRDLIDQYPGSPRVPRAWFMIAVSYEHLGETAAMNEHLALVVAQFPDSEVASLARERLDTP